VLEREEDSCLPRKHCNAWTAVKEHCCVRWPGEALPAALSQDWQGTKGTAFGSPVVSVNLPSMPHPLAGGEGAACRPQPAAKAPAAWLPASAISRPPGSACPFAGPGQEG